MPALPASFCAAPPCCSAYLTKTELKGQRGKASELGTDAGGSGAGSEQAGAEGSGK